MIFIMNNSDGDPDYAIENNISDSEQEFSDYKITDEPSVSGPGENDDELQ